MKTVWKPRTPEWIKANPKQGTMYKVLVDNEGNELNPEPPKPIEIITPLIKEQQTKPKDLSQAGVYLIICGIENHAYIGLSSNIDVRLRNHKMNIIDNKTKVKTIAYGIMREHYIKHGIEAFEFIKYKHMPNASYNELGRMEMQTLLEYHRMGYKLYNQQISMHILEFIT